MTPRHLPTPATTSADRPHGTRQKYKSGCRCLLCRAANARYESKRAKAYLPGGGTSLVSATAAREHILELAKAGLGRDALSAASDIATSAISRIKSGRSTLIRKHTEDKLLAISNDAVSDGSLVKARPTWRQINALLAEGFTKAELARRLNYKTGSLQLGKKWILARNAARVDRLYRMLMKE